MRMIGPPTSSSRRGAKLCRERALGAGALVVPCHADGPQEKEGSPLEEAGKALAEPLPDGVQRRLRDMRWGDGKGGGTGGPGHLQQGEGMDAARTEDFSSALAAELKSLKSGEKQQFQVWNTGIPGSVYIKFDSDYGKPGHDQLRLIYC
eukprot:evm.model.scf_1146EXC.1 EVM.evm.TU.scf_1146EXC.1   scf_1146EXC:998-2750(+)